MPKRKPVYEIEHIPHDALSPKNELRLSTVLLAMLFAMVIGIVLGAAGAV